jgi:hypothetical protein
MVDVTEEYVMKAVGMCGIHGLHGTSAMIMDLMKERVLSRIKEPTP